MGLFNKQAVPQTPAMKYNTARSNLLLVVAFTTINLVLTVLESDMYFLFSAAVPLFITALGAEIATLLSTEVPYIISIVAAVAMIGIYLICYFLSKNKRGWMIAALVLFALDCGFLLLNISVDVIVDLLFHAWVMYYLIVGVKNGGKQEPAPIMPSVDFGPAPQQPVMMVNGEPVSEETTEE